MSRNEAGVPRSLLLAVAVALLMLWGPAASARRGEESSRSSSMRLPPFERTTLANGLVLLLFEQHEVPLLSMKVAIRSGAAADPAGREGTAKITAALLRRGTREHGADELAETLDFLGAQLGGGAGHELSALEVELLAKDARQGMALLSEILLRPTFPEEEVSKRLARARDAVRRAKDQPARVIGRYFARFFYGPDHPYGRSAGGDEQSLARIRRDDLVEFHRGHYLPGNAILVMAGDLGTREMRSLAEKYLGPWKPGKLPKVEIPPTPAARPGRVLLVDKPDSPQTHFILAAAGVDRRHPDRTGLQVVNTLFGGRFTSWLNTRLRVEEGLTYGASSGFAMRRRAGHFLIRSSTATANTGRAIELAKAQLERLHREGPGPEELESVRRYIKGQFPPSLETADQIADILVALEYHGLGREEVDGFLRRVDAVDRSMARRLIRDHFPRPEDLVYVLIGKAAQIREKAEELGKLEEKEIAAPGF